MNYTRQNQPPLTKIPNIYEGKKKKIMLLFLYFFFLFLWKCPQSLAISIQHFCKNLLVFVLKSALGISLSSDNMSFFLSILFPPVLCRRTSISTGIFSITCDISQAQHMWTVTQKSPAGSEERGMQWTKANKWKNTNLVELVILPIKEGKVYILSVVLLFRNVGGDLQVFSYSCTQIRLGTELVLHFSPLLNYSIFFAALEGASWVEVYSVFVVLAVFLNLTPTAVVLSHYSQSIMINLIHEWKCLITGWLLRLGK